VSAYELHRQRDIDLAYAAKIIYNIEKDYWYLLDDHQQVAQHHRGHLLIEEPNVLEFDRTDAKSSS
jgi:hypothetical protein